MAATRSGLAGLRRWSAQTGSGGAPAAAAPATPPDAAAAGKTAGVTPPADRRAGGAGTGSGRRGETVPLPPVSAFSGGSRGRRARDSDDDDDGEESGGGGSDNTGSDYAGSGRKAARGSAAVPAHAPAPVPAPPPPQRPATTALLPPPPTSAVRTPSAASARSGASPATAATAAATPAAAAAAAAAAPSGGIRAIPFVVPDAAGGFTVTREALAFLGGIREPVAPIAVVGKYRTGKSFLLNKLVEAAGGFEVGPTIEACTKGIWVWSVPMYLALPDGTSVAVLYLDTEGIGAAGATAEHDARIFSLATLLCSLLIYNSVGAVDEEAIQALSFVANLTRHIQLRAGAGGTEAAVKAGAALEDAASDASGSDEEGRHGVRRRAAAGGVADSDASGSEAAGSGARRGAAAAGAAGGAGRTSRARGSGLLGFFRGARASAAAAATGGGGGGGTDTDASAADADGAGDAGDDDDGSDGAPGGGGPSDYVRTLKRDQRKRRAAAKRAQAVRLREEARRSAGLRREAALEGDKSAVVSRVEDEVSAFFPSFLWVLRDFSLQLADEDGSPLSARDYLEQCLQQQEGFSSDAQARNRTRRVLTSFFKDRDCATLVRPVEDEAQLQMIDSLPEAALRVEFRAQLAELKLRIAEELVRPKTMQGQFVTGRMLGGLAQAYVTAINAHAVPSIGNAWDGVTRVECKEALEAAFRVYGQGMDAAAPAAALPMDSEVLQRAHETARIHAIDAYEAKAVGPMAPKYRTELKDRIDSVWRVTQSANASASDTACTALITRLWHGRIEPRLQLTALEGSGKRAAEAAMRSPGASSKPPPGMDCYRDYEDFKRDVEGVREAYLAEASGPAVHRALATFLLEAAPVVVRAINAARAMEAEARTRELREAAATAARDAEVATARAAAMERQATDLRTERATSAVDRARAEAEARAAREERALAEERAADVERERAELAEKLKAERLAHAQTRLALRQTRGSFAVATSPGSSNGSGAVAGSDGGPASSRRPGAGMLADAAAFTPPPPPGRRPLEWAADGSEPAAVHRSTALPASTARPRGGPGTGGGAPASPTSVPPLRLRPRGADEIAMPGGHVAFPVAPTSGGACAPGGACSIQ